MFSPQGNGLSPEDQRRLELDLQGELDAIQRYGAHAAGTRNAMLQRLWQRIRHDELRHAQWLRMALARHAPGAGPDQTGGMGPMGNPGIMQQHRHMERHGQENHDTGAGAQTPALAAIFSPGQVVVPVNPHTPEHVNRAARVLETTQETVYVLDFGDGKPHRWYAQSELKLAPAGTRAGQTVHSIAQTDQSHYG